MPALRVALQTGEVPAGIEADWRRLEAAIEPRFFRSWTWIGTWLELTTATVVTARVFRGDHLIAIGLFGVTTETRHGVLRSRVAHLHQSGKVEEDQPWIEYNGLLADSSDQHAALTAVVATLFEDGYCDEVHLSMLEDRENCGSAMASLAAFSPRVMLSETGRWRDLAASREAGVRVVERLSANSRQQLRRGLRRYSELHGEAWIDTANDADEAVTMLHEAGMWHSQRWSDSGFTNPMFVRFHEGLIKRAFDHGSVGLYRVRFGEHSVGVFYFLFDAERAYFYLQGVRKEPDTKLKPGLVGHLLLMEHFLDYGMAEYDFMGGDSQYKRQLADRETAFLSLRLHRGDLRFRFEDRLRRIKNRFRG